MLLRRRKFVYACHMKKQAPKKSASPSPTRKPVVAFQGAFGAYSDMAAHQMYPRGTRLPCDTFADVFDALHSGRADIAVIPIDNSIAGRVADIHHLLPQYGFHFTGEHFLPIEHCLMAPKGTKLSDLKRVYSHAHALPQCRKLIRAMKLEPVVFGDTAGSAEKIAEMNDKTCGAIASAMAADLYGLTILKRDIADEKRNTTRFLSLARAPSHAKPVAGQTYVTSFLFHVRNIPSALYKALGGFATNGVNMLKLESYMPGGTFSSTLFYCEVEGHAADAGLKQAIHELSFFGYDVKIMGSYPASPWRLSQTAAAVKSAPARQKKGK